MSEFAKSCEEFDRRKLAVLGRDPTEAATLTSTEAGVSSCSAEETLRLLVSGYPVEATELKAIAVSVVTFVLAMVRAGADPGWALEWVWYDAVLLGMTHQRRMDSEAGGSDVEG